MNTCIFCKIISREIPADIVYEDKNFLAFLDINPTQKGHILLMPKSHYRWVQDIPDDLTQESALLQKKIMNSLTANIGCDYILIAVEGLQVEHAHTHLIPSYFDKKNADWHHVTYDPGEIAKYASKIRSVL